jgi:Rhodanese-like domain
MSCFFEEWISMHYIFSFICLIFIVFVSFPTRAEPQKPVFTAEDMRTTLMGADSAVLGLPQYLLWRQVNPNHVVLDVRSPERYAEKHIKGAINIPVTELTEKTLAEKIPDVKTPIAIMCDFSLIPSRMVPMTLQAYPVLKAAGYTKIYRLELWPGKTEEEIEAAVGFEGVVKP